MPAAIFKNTGGAAMTQIRKIGAVAKGEPERIEIVFEADDAAMPLCDHLPIHRFVLGQSIGSGK